MQNILSVFSCRDNGFKQVWQVIISLENKPQWYCSWTILLFLESSVSLYVIKEEFRLVEKFLKQFWHSIFSFSKFWEFWNLFSEFSEFWQKNISKHLEQETRKLLLIKLIIYFPLQVLCFTGLNKFLW